MKRRKPRGDAKLKTLSPELQEAVIRKLESGTQEDVLTWLRQEFDISTSAGALSSFYSWYQLGQDLQSAASFADDLRDTLKELPGLELRDDAINQAAQAVFEMRAAQSKDPDLFIELRKLRLAEHSAKTKARQKERELKLQERRVKLLEDQAERAAQAKTKLQEVQSRGGLTPDTLRAIEEAANLL